MRTVTLAVLCLTAVAMAGCDTLREEAGLTKQAPDEFAVVTKAPLIIPPDFNLHPPSAGAAPLNQQDPTGEAQAALFSSADPAVVAANMKGDLTPAEKMMLAQAGAQHADPNIRGQLQSDTPGMQGADPAFTNQVLAGTTTPQQNRDLRVPPKKKTRSWFDGWFSWL